MEYLVFFIFFLSAVLAVVVYAVYAKKRNAYFHRIIYMNKEMANLDNVNEYDCKKDFSYLGLNDIISKPEIVEKNFESSTYKKTIDDYYYAKRNYMIINTILVSISILAGLYLVIYHPDYLRAIFENDSP